MTAPRVLVFDAAPQRAAALLARLRARGFHTTVVRHAHGCAPDERAPRFAQRPLERNGPWDPYAASAPPAVAQTAGPTPDMAMTAKGPRPDMAVLLIDPDAPAGRLAGARDLLHHLVTEGIATVVCGGPADLRQAAGPLVEWLAPMTDPDEIVGKLDTLSRYVPLLQGMERELRHLRRLGDQLNRYFGEIDQEMRLAGRLQRDFLPTKLPQVGPFSFAALYRPASWVSGDLYDVQRVDEHHVAIFLADAMGHGVAAGLLTMFLRQALVPKRISGQKYTLVPPAEVLNELHTSLARQKLANSQFVTAVYGLLDTRSGDLRLARAGHPYPVLARPGPGGLTMHEIRSGGGLLGLADVPLEFEETSVRLAPGDKLILYTDGAEEVFVAGQAADESTLFTDQFHTWAALHPGELIETLEEHLDTRPGSLNPADDVTLIVLEMDTSAFRPLELAACAARPDAADSSKFKAGTRA
ncbi:MAG: PP2C family protein-serine/threonine phosphatase [Planctomycetota bacterium]